jgi:hypothetical protein
LVDGGECSAVDAERTKYPSLCVGISVLIGGFFFVVGGIMVNLFTAFAIPVLMIERTTVWRTLHRSFKLFSRNFVAILLLTLSVVLIVVVAIAAWFVVAVHTEDPSSRLQLTLMWSGIIVLGSLVIMAKATVTTVVIMTTVMPQGISVSLRCLSGRLNPSRIP